MNIGKYDKFAPYKRPRIYIVMGREYLTPLDAAGQGLSGSISSAY